MPEIGRRPNRSAVSTLTSNFEWAADSYFHIFNDSLFINIIFTCLVKRKTGG